MVLGFIVMWVCLLHQEGAFSRVDIFLGPYVSPREQVEIIKLILLSTARAFYSTI